MKTCDRVLDSLLAGAMPLAPAIAVASHDRTLLTTALDAAEVPLEAVRWIGDLADVPVAPGIAIIDLRPGNPVSTAALAYVAAGEERARLQIIVVVADDPNRPAPPVESLARIVPASRPDRLAAAIAAACVEVQARFALDRVQAKALREERRLMAMMTVCDDFIGLVDARGVIVKGSSRVDRSDGYGADELIGVNAFSQLHPEDVAVAHERLVRLLQHPGGRDQLRIRRRHKDGEYGTYDVTAINMLDDRDVGGIVVSFRDVSEVGAVQSALRVSEARLQLIAARLPLVLWIADPVAGRCEYVSPFFEPLWGRPRSELLADAGVWSAGIHAEDRASVPDPIAPIARPTTDHFRVVRPDGGLAYVESHRTPVFDERGRLVRMVGVALDITERRQLEHQLVEARALAPLAHLAGSVAHDFNNLIGGIHMLTEMMLSDADNAHLRSDLEDILQLTKRGEALTRRLLDFVRRRPSVMEPLCLAAVVQGMVGILRVLVGSGIELDVVVSDELPPVTADRTQLEEVILNLAVNARDAMSGRGTLRIAVAPGDGGATLRVADTGCGMDASLQKRVFEPFFTTKTRGTGLGLSIVAAAVRSHGGTIRVESTVGVGTVFEIALPAAQKERT